jgi:hypothetical protein
MKKVNQKKLNLNAKNLFKFRKSSSYQNAFISDPTTTVTATTVTVSGLPPGF